MRSALIGVALALATTAGAAEKDLSVYMSKGSDAELAGINLQKGEYRGFALNWGANFISREGNGEDTTVSALISKEFETPLRWGSVSLTPMLGLENTIARSDLGQSGFVSKLELEYRALDSLGIGIQASYNLPYLEDSFYGLGLFVTSNPDNN
jgi:hypothetical protein